MAIVEFVWTVKTKLMVITRWYLPENDLAPWNSSTSSVSNYGFTISETLAISSTLVLITGKTYNESCANQNIRKNSMYRRKSIRSLTMKMSAPMNTWSWNLILKLSTRLFMCLKSQAGIIPVGYLISNLSLEDQARQMFESLT